MTTTRDDLDTPAGVLGFVRGCKVDADRAEADLLAGAVLWAEQHPAESITGAAVWPVAGMESEVALAGEGAPLVAEFCIAEFATAIGRSTDSGRALLAQAIELKHRLPRHWARVQAGTLEPWRARRVAEATLGLSLPAAGHVDAQLAAYAHKIGPAQLERLVEEAIARFMPDTAQENAERAADGRHVTFHHQQIGFNGTTCVEAELDLADALDLDAAISAQAEALRQAGCTEPLDVRRAMAAGELARRQLTLDLAGHLAGEPARAGERSVKARQVVLYVHLSEAALTGAPTPESLDLARVENHRQVVTADQVRTWCANPDTTVTVTPVIDLAEHIAVGAYEIPDRLRAQAVQRDHTCVFPWCHRSARTCDIDHAIPHQRSGPTSSENTAPLCRRHHRLKTHSPWTYTVLDPGTYLWTSPHGYQFLRDHTGTLDVSPDRPTPSSDPPDG
jgi:hypothetical protein